MNTQSFESQQMCRLRINIVALLVAFSVALIVTSIIVSAVMHSAMYLALLISLPFPIWHLFIAWRWHRGKRLL